MISAAKLLCNPEETSIAQMNLGPNVQQSREKSKNPKEANTAPERHTQTHTHPELVT
jgi:hypothetical protein